jgi:acyl-CoA hydrolase
MTKEARPIGAAEAAALVTSGMWLDYGGLTAAPGAFDAALAVRIGELHDIKLRTTLNMAPLASMAADPEGRHIRMFNLHYSALDRRASDAGRCEYIPVNLGEIDDYYRRFIEPVDIAVIRTAPRDAQGNYNLGNIVIWHRAVIERARCVVVETSPAIPWCHGEGNAIHESEIDYVIEGSDAPLAELPAAAPSPVDRAVGRHIAAEIGDGACLQIGIGAMPNAVCAMLREAGVKNLGIHTEMLTDGLADLYRAGQVTGTAKAIDPGRIVYSFAAGSKALYDTIDRNPDFFARATGYTNLPHIVMRNPNVVAINNTTQIDLQGQAASESDGHRHISGTGGQLQFVRGAYASEGGRSFICLSSTYERHGLRKSRIVFDLTPGNIVTTPRSDMMYVVTEYGCVNLKGKSVSQRAKALIGLAHPDFREELERQAHGAGLMPRLFTL